MIEIRPGAVEDFHAAIGWYDRQAAGFGDLFAAELDRLHTDSTMRRSIWLAREPKPN